MAGKRKARSKRKDPVEKKPKVEEETATTTTPIEEEEEADDSKFIGEPVPDEEARNRWPHRYPQDAKGKREGTSVQCLIGDGTGDIILAKLHYSMAEVDGILYKLDDDAHVKAEEGKKDYICKLMEMFVARDGTYHFTAQWYYRASDTVITTSSNLIDEKRVFFSEVRDDNMLSSLVRKLVIGRLPLHVDASVRNATICTCDYYCDTLYLIPYASFVSLPNENVEAMTDSSSTISDELEGEMGGVNSDTKEIPHVGSSKRAETNLLDLYSGCGAMSTGLCLGAAASGVNLVTKWAVDINPDACRSLKYNHPHTEVRNETAEDFLHLLKEWKCLCLSLNLIGCEDFQQHVHDKANDGDRHEEDATDDDEVENDSEVFEVEKVMAISYSDPNNKKAKRGLYFKIRWRGYGEEDDTWEPYDSLSDCQGKIKEFVSKGLQSKILPLPGSVDVICGGPPCQGISGFNRFRNKASPLDDPKNHQLVVFMDIVEFLKPRFVLMENVVDIVRFSGGYLGRYALGRLVGMNYQARLGMMVAGAYGLPQFRMRVFMWGALPTENLPQYPLPTHNVVVRGNIPQEFESCCVAYEAENRPELEKELVLKDAIFDLPPVANDEERDEMPYNDEPITDFQKSIRLRKDEFLSSSSTSGIAKRVLFDHRPLKLNNDDYLRVLQIPKKKGANYRDLEGVKVNSDNVAEFDPDKERVLLPSGKPLVPDYAVKFINGTSSKPFGRLWWDETVPTVVTRAEPHNQVILHPSEDRVLTVRENARLQGFPDYYKLFGTIKERYIQVGNAVAIPVSRALGYALALAVQKSSDGGPLLTLPRNFPNHNPGQAPTIETDV